MATGFPRAFRGYARDAVDEAFAEATARLERVERERDELARHAALAARERSELVGTFEKAIREQRLLLESFERLTREHAALLDRVGQARAEPLPRPVAAVMPAVRTRWERLAERFAGRPTT
jgi:hypothetical protein